MPITPGAASSGLSNPDHHKVSGFVIVVAAIAAVGGLLFGYDTGVISGAILFIKKQYGLGTTMQEVTVSMVLVGALLGAALGGLLGDRFGRRRMIIDSAIIFGVGALLTALTPDFPLLVIGRVIVGVGIGIASFIAPMYISEVAPKSIRGTLVFLNQLALTIGILLAYFVDYVFTSVPGGWRWMLGLALIPALVLGIGMQRMPDSPRWLMMRKSQDQARRVLQKIRGTNAVDAEVNEIQSSLSTEGSSQWSDLLHPALRKPLIVGMGLAIFQQVTGINTVIYYAPTIMEFSGLKSAGASILATTGIGVVNVIFTIIGSWFVDRAGRRPLLIISLSGMAISLALLAISFQLPQLASSLGIAVVVILMLYVASFAIGLGPVFWLPMNYLLIESLQRYYRFLGDDFKVECPTGSGQWLTLKQVAETLSQQLLAIFRRQPDGSRPLYGDIGTFQHDPHWRDLLLFHEYFHGDNGAGLGASQQAGWTALVAKLLEELQDPNVNSFADAPFF